MAELGFSIMKTSKDTLHEIDIITGKYGGQHVSMSWRPKSTMECFLECDTVFYEDIPRLYQPIWNLMLDNAKEVNKHDYEVFWRLFVEPYWGAPYRD